MKSAFHLSSGWLLFLLIQTDLLEFMLHIITIAKMAVVNNCTFFFCGSPSSMPRPLNKPLTPTQQALPYNTIPIPIKFRKQGKVHQIKEY